jgi:TonB family protein
MSVEPSDVTSEVWMRWQGHVVNGVFPLGRYLGCSDHSGVFLTQAATRPSELAIKLVPTNRALAESLLPRWKRAGGLAHPHLLRLVEWGGCQLEGLPYLYAVMEYADQTLAQLLSHRALTDDEAREMMLPTLDALAFLHGRSLVQGQLKPTNILVVGDQLKLASDTIRRVTDGPLSTHPLTLSDPPEARYGSSSPAGDVWALGVSLFEAFTRRPLAGRGEPREVPVPALPADFSPAFHDIVSRCLSPSPQDRPSVSELMTRARGHSPGSAPAANIQPATLVLPPQTTTPRPPPQPGTPEPPRAAPPEVAPKAALPVPPVGRRQKLAPTPMLILAAVVILVLGWTGLRLLGPHRTAVQPLSPVPTPEGSSSQNPGDALPAVPQGPAPGSAASTTNAGRSAVATSPSATHEVIPEVPSGARRTIRGHIKVWVRVIVEPDGSVFAAVVDRSGPSSYFQRLATEAAKKWTFPPVDTPSRRTMQIRFDFNRDGTTGHAVTLH